MRSTSASPTRVSSDSGRDRRQRHLECRHAGGGETGVDGREMDEAPDHQRAADEQHDGHRHFRDDQRVLHAAGADDRPAARLTAQSRVRVRRAAAGRRSRRTRGRPTAEIAIANPATVTSMPISPRRGMLMPGKTSRRGPAVAKARSHDKPIAAMRNPTRTGEQGEQRAFGDMLPQQSHAARAERSAQRHLVLPHGGPGQHEVGDVDARDQQDEDDGNGEHRHCRRERLDEHVLHQRDLEPRTRWQASSIARCRRCWRPPPVPPQAARRRAAVHRKGSRNAGGAPAGDDRGPDIRRAIPAGIGSPPASRRRRGEAGRRA